jgi:aldoxime dehydratase
MQIRFVDTAPEEAHGPAVRLAPIRKPAGFTPAVQRWSFLLPEACPAFRIGFFAVQGRDAEAIEASGFAAWAEAA